MPTVDHVSLRNLIDSARRLDELGVARVIANVADAVHKQQKGGQPLGTITPDAIIVQADGDVTLRLADSKAAYTAPEKLRGEACDRRSDVFALGAVLWEALAHEPLFQGEIEGEIKAAVLEGEYRSASEANANVPAELDAICKKALSRSPADRYPSCKVMAAEIGTVLDDAGYPEDNSAIADHLATKYIAPEPKPEPVVTSRATPIPGTPVVAAAASSADRPGSQTLQGHSPLKEIEAAKARIAATNTEPPIELTTKKAEPIELTTKKAEPIELATKKVDPAKTLIAPAELKPPADTRAKPPSSVAPAIPPDPARAKTPSSQPVAPAIPPLDPARAKTPSSQPVGSQPAGALPSWATARPGSPSQAPATTPTAQPEPASTLPGMPTMLNTPPPPESPKSFSKTAVLGSLSSADLALPPVEPSTTPAAQLGKKTEVHGSASLADRLAAINEAAGTPAVAGLPAVPPGADPAAAKPAAAPITTAETVPTPALASYAAAEAKAAAALDAVKQPTPPTATPEVATIVPQPPVLPQTHVAVEAKTPPPSEARAMPAAATATAADSHDAVPHPASVVTLPRARSKTDGGRDPLAGWGWGTGPHEAIQSHDDDDFFEHQKSTKKRLIFAIGGAAGAVLLVVVAAFAFGGSKDDNKKQADVAAKQAEPAVDWSQPTDPPPPPTQPDPNAVDPNAGSNGSAIDPNAAGSAAIDPSAGSAGSAVVDPNAGSAGSAAVLPSAGSAVEPTKTEPPPTPPTPPEVVKTEPPKTEPPKPEPPKAVVKTEPPKPEPPKTEPPKPEPPKKEPPKAVAKTEPPKKEPPKKLPPPKPVAKTAPPGKEPKTASWDPLKAPVKPKEAPKPVDPYADAPKKPAVDANVAYKTGIQQFARGDANGALSTFKQSLSTNPDFAPTWRGIGMVYEKLGKKSQAKTAFRRYLQLSPSAGDAEQIRERMERL